MQCDIATHPFLVVGDLSTSASAFYDVASVVRAVVRTPAREVTRPSDRHTLKDPRGVNRKENILRAGGLPSGVGQDRPF